MPAEEVALRLISPLCLTHVAADRLMVEICLALFHMVLQGYALSWLNLGLASQGFPAICLAARQETLRAGSEQRVLRNLISDVDAKVSLCPFFTNRYDHIFLNVHGALRHTWVEPEP